MALILKSSTYESTILSTDENIEKKEEIALRELFSLRHNVSKSACWSRAQNTYAYGKGP